MACFPETYASSKIPHDENKCVTGFNCTSVKDGSDCTVDKILDYVLDFTVPKGKRIDKFEGLMTGKVCTCAPK